VSIPESVRCPFHQGLVGSPHLGSCVVFFRAELGIAAIFVKGPSLPPVAQDATALDGFNRARDYVLQ